MSNEGDDELSRVVGCTPIRLEDMHLAEIRSLIARLPVDLMKQSQEEKNLERFQKLIELYGDEPQLLDPPMPELIESLVRHIQWQDSGDIGRLNAAALVRLQVLSAVRGYKFLIRFIPHNIELLESVLSSLERLAKHLAVPVAVVLTPLPGPSTSRVNPAVDRQILQFLVVWLMIICKNPFNLGRIQAMESQSDNGNTATHLSIPERIVACLDAILEYMTTGGGLNVVPNLLAQILTRNVDNRPALTTRFGHFQRCFQEFQHDLDGGKQLINQLALANAMLKLARRDEIHPFAIRLFRSLSPDFMGAQKCQNILIRNLITKLMQRIALVLLRPKLAPWRYRCGHRSLEENLRRAPGREEEVKAMESKKSDERREEDGQKETDEEINKHIPYDEVELLLGQLLLKVRDRDNLVRWTASKGVARICARIPLEMAAQVVAAVFNDCFRSVDADSDETASAWMGGCLTVAELCRRGCLLPEQVPKVISDVLSRALIFEQSQSGFVLAVNVRDAACYICWAFARAYEASLLRPHFHSLGGTLLCTALFDREVNVRRAASAAFQENVGRNDSFPQGIPVIQRVDYMAVARIRHCYLELSVQIAQFADYIRPMLNHLCSLKLRHWDKTLRELAADALQRLAPFDVDHAGNELLPDLCRRLQSPDSAEAHGAFFGMASLLEALAGQRDALLHQIHPQLIEAIRQRASKLESHRSQGFSLAGKSLCRLIEALCKTGCQLEDEQLTQFHDILDTVVGDRNAQMAGQAVNAFPWLMAYYEDQQHFQLLMERLRGKYFAELDNLSQTEQLRCSCILPLGHLRPRFLDARFPNNPDPRRKIAATQPTLGSALFCKLFDVIEDPKTPKWVFARVAAIETMVRLVLNAHQQPPRFFYTLDWPKLVECLCHAADDYTATTNGNIGRFARRAAVLAMGQLLPVAFEKSGKEEGEAMITRPQLTMAIGKIVERACESIDDLREKASTVLASLVQFGPTTQLRSNIAELELLRSVFLLSSSANDGSAISSPRTTIMDEKEEEKEQQQLVTDVREEDGAELHGAEEEEKVATDFVAVDWRQSKGFARLAPLLGSQAYGENALNGFVLSAGSICAWTRENAFLAIASHLKPHKRDMEFLNSFLDRLSRVYGTLDARGCDPSPVLILFRMLLNDGQLRALERQPDSSAQFTRFCELVFTLVKVKGRSKVKLEAIAVLGSLLQLNPESGLYRRVLGLLLSLLDSPYAALREKAAQQLFEAFSLLVEDELEESAAEGEEPASATTGNCVGQAVELLSQTDWGAANELAEMRRRSEQIREFLLLRKSIQE